MTFFAPAPDRADAFWYFERLSDKSFNESRSDLPSTGFTLSLLRQEARKMMVQSRMENMLRKDRLGIEVRLVEGYSSMKLGTNIISLSLRRRTFEVFLFWIATVRMRSTA
jgi:hypothetical protein